MSAPRSHRNLLPSTNAALEALEAATGKPVTIVEDQQLILEYHYAARLNLASDGNNWIISHNGVEELGCIHTCQDLEVETNRVIIVPDLVYSDGMLKMNPAARARSDKSLRDWKQVIKTDPEGTKEHLSRLIRYTYRTLMSRGLRSCWVFAYDKVLQEYLRRRIEKSQGLAG